MLHWPDSMITYLEEDRLLFTQDAFGMHLASNERFADEIDEALLAYESAKYFANILLPFAPRMGKFMEKLEGFGREIRMIAPDQRSGVAAESELDPRSLHGMVHAPAFAQGGHRV